MEKPEYYVVAPSVKTFGGIKVEKDTEFETWNDDKTVHQTLKDLKLTTEIKIDTEYGDYKTHEESKSVTELPEGIVLIWGEKEGYIIPQYHMVKVEDAIKSLEQIKEITEPIEKGKENESKGE